MIVNEIVKLNNEEFKHTYSNENFYIRKKNTNEIYSDAYDLMETNYKYLETDDKIENIGENING